MPLKDWIQPLGDSFQLFVHRVTKNGITHEFSVVLIYQGICISRYDTAHGRPHRDIMGKSRGWIDFVEYKDMNYNQVFGFALRDYEKNYEAYLDLYLRN